MIALIGTHGTGKTSLLKAFKKVKPDWIVTDGCSRLVRSFNREVGNKLSEKEEQLLINRISDVQWPNEVKTEKLIQTRTPLDHYAYSRALNFYDYAKERLELFRGSDYDKVKFFYIPIEFELEDDGVRYIDPDFQKEIDSLLRSIIKEFNIPIIKLTGSLEERLQTLITNI